MAGNSQRKGAMRNAGSKKGATVGSGGQRRKALKGKGPTPKATERSYHPAAKRERAAAKRAEAAAKRQPATPRRSSGREDGSMLMGRNPVVEALRAKVPAKALYVQARLEADDRLREALRLAVAANITLHEVAKPELDRMTEGGAHQGMVLTMPSYDYADLDDLRTGSLLIALDGVTDPRNLGAVARSAAAFGADGIVIPSRRSAGVTASAWKTSAGALARVPLQKDGFTVVGLAADGPEDIAALPVLTDRLVLVIGSEGDGLSRLVGETCDWLARIAMASGNESLNASVAAGIALHTVFAARG